MESKRAVEALPPADGREAQRQEEGRDGGRRIPGVDLARALAIIGMFAAHVGPTYLESPAGRLYALPHGRASVLFVVLAGVGVSLLAGSRSKGLAEARRRLLWRAWWLLPAGLVLQALKHGVLVILQTYAALYLVGIAACRLPRRRLLAAALFMGAAGPAAFFLAKWSAPGPFTRTAPSIFDPAGLIVHKLALSGAYPLITWAAPFLFGMWLGRFDLADRRLRIRLLVYGFAAAVSAPALSAVLQSLRPQAFDPALWSEWAGAAAHSQAPLWLAGSTGAASAALGLSLLAADAADRMLQPLAAMGRLSLTVYVGHLLALHRWPHILASGDLEEAVRSVLLMSAAAAAFAAFWLRRKRRGPLEQLLLPPAAWLAPPKTRQAPRRLDEE